MGAPEKAWDSLRLDRDFGGLTGGGFAVRARTQGRPEELWLNIELPDGSWSYVVLREGTVVANERAETKRQAYMRAVEAVAHTEIG